MFSKALFLSQRKHHGKDAGLTKLESNVSSKCRIELGITEKWVLKNIMKFGIFWPEFNIG